MTSMTRIRIGGQHPYDIEIGPGTLKQLDVAQWPLTARQFLVVSDSNVAPLYLDALRARLLDSGCEVASHVFPAGESAKTLHTFEQITDALAEMGARRDACIVALGGGVVGDMAGFAAACWMRGIDFLQIPTSLLAMVDSSVGGKTGIDTPAGKNLLGAFHFPRAVLIDPDLLSTLPPRERSAGFAEVVKYGAIGDAAFFSWLEQNTQPLKALAPAEISRAVADCCRMKADIVERDPYERGERALLNFGHTFGHAIEASQGFGGLNHGEAVAVGMCCAARLSERHCNAPPADSERLVALLKQFELPTRLPEGLRPEELVSRMRLDKKADKDGLRFVLWDGIGRARVVTGIDGTEVLAMLQQQRD